MTPDQYCQERAAKSGSSFYYSFLFLPEERRRAITALYAFCREVDDVVDECRDVAVARTKLAWWRTEVARIYAGNPQHPVGQALAPAVVQFGLAEEYFHEVIDGMEMDLEQSRYADFQELTLYCYRVAGVVGILSATIFGYEDRHTMRYAHDLGIAFQLTNILRDVGEDLRRDRVYIPQNELAERGLTVEDLRRGEPTAALLDLFKCQADRARTFYQAAFNKLPEADRYNQRAGLIMAAIYLRTLDEIAARGYPVLRQRVRLSPWRKLWLAWRTARGEEKRRQRYLKGSR